MQKSKELMKAAGIKPRLKLGQKTEKGVISTGPHTVKMVSDRIIEGIDQQSGQPTQFVIYTFEYEGEEMQYRTRVKSKETGELSYLVQNMAQIKEGDTVILEMKKAGVKNYVEVRTADGSLVSDDEPEAIDDEDIEEAMDSVEIDE